ncbi:MAG: glycerophosphodiester phosphodiesterase family protein [Candidatus Thiodiazotropha sp.]
MYTKYQALPVVRIAHRGGAGHAPENTLSAIERSLAFGVDYIEIDLQLTKDGRLVVIHDKRVDRTTNGDGYVSELNLEYLRSLDAGNGEHVPLFSEVLELVGEHAGIMIEMRSRNIAGKLVEQVCNAGTDVPVIYASFLHSELISLRAIDSSAVTMALLEGVPIGGAQFAEAAHASHVGLGFDSITPEFVDTLHLKGLQVYVYTLNHPSDIELALEMGVDGIISDYPERIRSG